MSVGFPQTVWLQEFGEFVFQAFGQNVAYHVGSSMNQKDGWRDVDVRVLLEDEDYAAQGYGDPDRQQSNPKWVAMCLAWSAFGQKLTGLPIDFQIQPRSWANAKFNSGRSALLRHHGHNIGRSATFSEAVAPPQEPLPSGVQQVEWVTCQQCGAKHLCAPPQEHKS